MASTVIKARPNGPFVVSGDFEVYNAKGVQLDVNKEDCHLCRCGASNNKPFCDGSHHRVDFKDE